MRHGRLALLLLLAGVAACAKGRGHEAILTRDAPPPIAPYSQAIRAGNTLYVSGQLGVDPATGALVQGGVVAEAHQSLKNLGAILAAAGYGYDDVVQVQVFLDDMKDFGLVNGAYRAYFKTVLPARAAVEVRRLPLDARVEILAIAVH
jgi:2-iminobutanoate/2-iminopropanoate deaminase